MNNLGSIKQMDKEQDFSEPGKTSTMREMSPYSTSNVESRNFVASSRIIVLCGSMSFMHTMLSIQQQLSSYRVASLVPDDVDHTFQFAEEALYNQFKRDVSLAHIRKIRNPRTYGILAVNCEKRGISSYIGPNTFAEIAIAFAYGKRIFVLDRVPNNYADELHAWGAQELHGNLRSMVERLKTAWTNMIDESSGSDSGEHALVDCYCVTCDRWFHHLGIARHRAMHRDRKEDCEIEYSDGRIGRHFFSIGGEKARCQKLCQSGTYETGEGTCAPICLDQLGSPRDKPGGCPHVMKVFKEIRQ